MIIAIIIITFNVLVYYFLSMSILSSFALKKENIIHVKMRMIYKQIIQFCYTIV